MMERGWYKGDRSGARPGKTVETKSRGAVRALSRAVPPRTGGGSTREGWDRANCFNKAAAERRTVVESGN